MTEEEDFLDRHADRIAKALDEQHFDDTFQKALEVNFQKWCDGQWAQANGFTPIRFNGNGK